MDLKRQIPRVRFEGLLAITLVGLVGCATAGPEGASTVDGNTHGSGGSTPDASNTSDICTTGTDLLMNGAFDMTPVGMGWSGTPANPLYPIITANGLTPDSTPNKAWMGSVVSATDEMYEDVTVPAGATKLTFAGVYEVRTTETGTTANDTSTIEIDDTSGTMIESVLAIDNTSAGTTWVPFTHTTTTAVAGKTLRIHFASSNNATKATSFYFDTVSFQISGCQ